MTKKIYGATFSALALVAAILLYPKYPILCGITIGFFALAFILQGIALSIRLNKKAGQQ